MGIYDEQLERKIHFREVDVPHCGACKWFERMYSDTYCRNLENCDKIDDDFYDEQIFPHEANVCDRFEKEENDDDDK